MHRRPLVAFSAALLLGAFGIASAQNAFTSRPMNVRAGPNRDYPLVAQLDQGTPLDVHGCLSDWSWCDASFGGGRGWIYAGGLSFVYEGNRVPLFSYGPRLGLPIITFSLLPYWDDYYRGRPWYSQRNDWSHRRMPPHMRPPGRPRGGPAPISRGRPMPQRRPMGFGRPSMQHGQPSRGGHPAPRSEERGHGRPMQRQQHPAGPPHGRGAPGRGQSRTDHDNGGRPHSPP